MLTDEDLEAIRQRAHFVAVNMTAEDACRANSCWQTVHADMPALLEERRALIKDRERAEAMLHLATDAGFVAAKQNERLLELVEGLAMLWVQDATEVTKEAWRISLYAPHDVDVDVEGLRNNARTLLKELGREPH